MKKSQEKGKFSGRFSCVWCGQKVEYNAEKNKLICTNPECPKGQASYGWNPLAGCVWAGIIPFDASFETKDSNWSSVGEEYILDHKEEFNIVREKVRIDKK
jgi:hypothetical protein